MKLDAIQFNISTTDTPSWTKLVDLIYPTNSIYLTRGTNVPGDSIGGNWTAINTGAVLALTGSNGFATVGKNGGSLKISVNQMPSHRHVTSVENSWIAFWCTVDTGTGVLANANNGQWGCMGNSTVSGKTFMKNAGGGGRIICLIIILSKDTTELPSNGGDVE
nr:MAG TPA: Baseplate structural protein [Caudoviricetes sp.]